MTAASLSIPEVVDLHSAGPLARALTRHIEASPNPVVSADSLVQGSLPLLQILVAGCRMSRSLGKSFAVEASPDGALTRLLSIHGLDPALCGVVADPGPEAGTAHTKGT